MFKGHGADLARRRKALDQDGICAYASLLISKKKKTMEAIQPQDRCMEISIHLFGSPEYELHGYDLTGKGFRRCAAANIGWLALVASTVDKLIRGGWTIRVARSNLLVRHPEVFTFEQAKQRFQLLHVEKAVRDVAVFDVKSTIGPQRQSQSESRVSIKWRRATTWYADLDLVQGVTVEQVQSVIDRGLILVDGCEKDSFLYYFDPDATEYEELVLARIRKIEQDNVDDVDSFEIRTTPSCAGAQ